VPEKDMLLTGVCRTPGSPRNRRADGCNDDRPKRVVNRSSTALGCAPPILPWTNDWDLIDSLQVEQITIDAH
jgi:hypothetical protein